METIRTLARSRSDLTMSHQVLPPTHKRFHHPALRPGGDVDVEKGGKKEIFVFNDTLEGPGAYPHGSGSVSFSLSFNDSEVGAVLARPSM